jgi:hypothetical protein
MTQGLIISRRTKKSLHVKSVSDPSPANITRYKTFKQIYQRLIRAAKKLSIAEQLRENASNPKKTWQTLNELLGRKGKSESVSDIKINDEVTNDSSRMANHFNSFFTSVGKKISNSVQPVSKKPEDYVDYGRDIPAFQLGNTTPEHIIQVIKKFSPKNSCDINGVSTKMIKFVCNEIAVPLSHIFNLSLSSGQFPSALKLCRVIPIFKAGDPQECDNYRPISLLSSISKILEKIVAEKLVFHLKTNDLLYQHQYGFIAKKSTEHNLMHIVNFITSALNDGMYCIGVFLDLKKAFDVCSHSILLAKLNKMGIQGTALDWFKNYLSGRSQKVEINGILSDPLELDISVIQGSILGPILFLCYINDFWLVTTLFSILFADDTTCLGKGKNLRELIIYVNSELQKISNWFRANKMAVNAAKTKYIVFRTRGKPINPLDCTLVFNNNEIGVQNDPDLIYPIERIYNDGETKSFKLLGVLFDEYLCFDEHITHLCNKISKSIFCINRVKNFVDLNTRKLLYFALIHSHIMYCLTIYSCANATNMNKLKIKQKAAIRIVCNSGFREHTGPLFSQLKILPIDQLVTFSILKFMHSFTHNSLPFSFQNTWSTNRNRFPERELRNANNLFIPAHNFATLKRMPIFNFPAVWNSAGPDKFNPIQHRYLKSLKCQLLNNI